MKIIYCINSISRIGGTEHITVEKANALTRISGNEVWIVVPQKNDNYSFPLDKRVNVINLDIKYYDHDWEKNRLQQFISILAKKKEHKHKLKEILDAIKPNIVISTGGMEMSILPLLSRRSSSVFIQEFHFTTNNRRLRGNSFFEKLIIKISVFYDYMFAIHRYDRIATLTHEDKEAFWKNNDKVIVIPNYITNHHTKLSLLTSKTVISIGRLAREKNFYSLIRSWDNINLSHPDWKLEIWGNGEEKEYLYKTITELQLQKVVFLRGWTNDVFTRLSEASVFVLTSINEGFGLAIIEAMSCGLPVVAYDCPYGPRSIITDGKDGFLVPVGDEQMLTERINYLIEHENVRQQMGADKNRNYKNDHQAAVFQQCREYEKATWKAYWRNSHINLIEKIVVTILLHNPQLTHWLMKVTKNY